MKLTEIKFYYCVFVLLASVGSNCLAQNDIDRLALIDNAPTPIDKIVCEKGQCKMITMSLVGTFRLMGVKEGDVIKKWNDMELGQKGDEKKIFKVAYDLKDQTAVIERNGKEMVLHYPKKASGTKNQK